MEIKRNIEKIPGGIMIVPLFLGALLNTFAPGTGKYLGSFTNGLITGALPILAVWFFCMGASISLKATPTVLRKGGVLVLTKILTAATVGLIASHFIAPSGIQSGFLAGISVLALVAAMNDTNGGLYMALMQQYGNPEEAGAFALMSLESGPFMTMLTLGMTGLGAFPWQTLLGALIPFVAGFALGNLDKECRKFFSAAVPVMVPFFAFALGNTLNFSVILHTGLLGICMGLFVIAVTGGVLILADVKLGGGTGTAGVAAASTAGAAVTVPQIVASIDPQFSPVAAAATALIATSVVVTAILTPMLTAAWAKHHPYAPKRRELAATSGIETAIEASKA